MRQLAYLLALLTPSTVFACGAPVCLIDPDSLNLPQMITFDDLRSSAGPGHNLDEILALQGATFGERFVGQQTMESGTHDQITGDASAPLTMLPGAAGQNLSVVHFYGNTVLNGYGPAGFPKREGQGEGAIAVLFDSDQSALAFDLRGGEAGRALVAFHRRDGRLIGQVPVSPTGEFAVGFLRSSGAADIAGFIVTNTDPEGLAIDTLRFGKPPDLS
ncbi:hypothetical protein Z946_3329 [Sulfitobacter noctilucicola]|uniref:Uncharacterized protein n=1 Tax=Sulfitobacter noctilucicola TaxID=1342301 RepID=A0A7W6M8G4_9RHOB|nr:hypothetical protein [Sulfitobacter noctilucicola]KIN64438.1 hypothetical protein Z946_3329 [Sulfitobacter noctilucicola]MBB4174403.1 hypothetical protein [Sulfitobacter noctilucicola]